MRRRIETLHLFPVLEENLLALLRSLSDEEWTRPTVAKLWTVKDVAAHLFDGNLRTLSGANGQLNWDSPGPIDSNAHLVEYLNGLNADWVKAMNRLSPRVLIDLLEWSGKKYYEHLSMLNPEDNAVFPVDWAGDQVSPNWFHIAREYTEKWHHQQQIREATGRKPLFSKELYYPVLDIFMTALPFTYLKVKAPKGTVVKVSITGEGGGDWCIMKKDQWELDLNPPVAVAAHVTIDGTVAWKLFTKSWRRKEVEQYVTIDGDQNLGSVALEMISVMA